MTEINERLARFAWPDAKKIEIYHGRLCVDWSSKGGWVYEGLPFTESLDAQEKYLWPKLSDWTFSPEWKFLKKTGQYRAWVTIDGVHGMGSVAATPALASAQAIAKLLEGKS